MSSRGRTRPLSGGRSGGRLPTLPGERRPGNAANLNLTDSTHLSVSLEQSKSWIYVGKCDCLSLPGCIV